MAEVVDMSDTRHTRPASTAHGQGGGLRDRSVSPSSQVCELCGAFENLRLCGRCGESYYCSKEHQRKDWKAHKRHCNPRPAEPVPVDRSTTRKVPSASGFSTPTPQSQASQTESESSTAARGCGAAAGADIKTADSDAAAESSSARARSSSTAIGAGVGEDGAPPAATAIVIGSSSSSPSASPNGAHPHEESPATTSHTPESRTPPSAQQQLQQEGHGSLDLVSETPSSLDPHHHPDTDRRGPCHEGSYRYNVGVVDNYSTSSTTTSSSSIPGVQQQADRLWPSPDKLGPHDSKTPITDAALPQNLGDVPQSERQHQQQANCDLYTSDSIATEDAGSFITTGVDDYVETADSSPGPSNLGIDQSGCGNMTIHDFINPAFRSTKSGASATSDASDQIPPTSQDSSPAVDARPRDNPVQSGSSGQKSVSARPKIRGKRRLNNNSTGSVSAPAPSAPKPPEETKLADYVVKMLNDYGICVIDNFMAAEKAECIQQEVFALKANGKFQDGQTVQKGTEDRIRGDKITWVEKGDENCESIGTLITRLDALMISCKGRLSNHNINGRTKAMVACYPGDGTGYRVYRRHIDNPQGDGRCVTCIYYLNKDWNLETDGGLLRIFPVLFRQVADIEPKFDRLLFFWSDRRNPHEVQPAYKTRFAITVWYFDAEERKKAKIRHKVRGLTESSQYSNFVEKPS